MNAFLPFVEQLRDALHKARNIVVEPSRLQVPQVGPVVMLFSPHPDDECVTGLLPLRLMHEAGWRVVNVPVTFGSNVQRRQARASELKDACAYLGWQIERREGDVDPLGVDDIREALTRCDPRAIVVPHAQDWNSRHMATHELVWAALQSMDSAFRCNVIETEYWGAMDDPNLMVEADAESVAQLVAATSLHGGEIARNPYHLLLPAWMQDNVRRGGELVCGQGAAPPGFEFATLYRLGRWQDGNYRRALDVGETIPMGSSLLKELF